MKRRVVIDTSTLVGAAIRPDSVPDQALTLAMASSQLCTSAEHLAEVEIVFRRERFDRYISRESRLALLGTIRKNSVSFTVSSSALNELRDACRDANDRYLLALSVIAEAHILISSDNDLLVLHPWRGIQILTPAQFLSFPIQPQLY